METHEHAREGNPESCLKEGKTHSMNSPPQVSNLLSDLLSPHHAATGCHNKYNCTDTGTWNDT